MASPLKVRRAATDRRSARGAWPDTRRRGPGAQAELYRPEDPRDSAHFKNGDDLKAMIGKLQRVEATVSERSEGAKENMLDGWDYVNPAAPYDEFLHSPFRAPVT